MFSCVQAHDRLWAEWTPASSAPSKPLRIVVRFSRKSAMSETGNGHTLADETGKADGVTEMRRQEGLLKTGALQNAIFSSANFSIIATDEKGIIQLFNVGAERMLGYLAAEVVNRINPSDIHDPLEVSAG